jgi:molybdopterin converting factor small subunit
MRIQIRLFAAARQLAGRELVQLEFDDQPTVAQAREALARNCPALKSLLPHVRFAVNMCYVPDNTRLLPADEVACIPAVSGG